MTIFAKLALTFLVIAVTLGLLTWGGLQVGPMIDEGKERDRWATLCAVLALGAVAAALVALACGVPAMLEIIWSS